VSRREDSLNPIQIIPAYKQPNHVTSSWFTRPDRGTQRVIIDTPSGLNVIEFRSILMECDAIIIPVLPSAIDTHAVTRFIGVMLLQGKFRSEEGRMVVVANRARKNTLIYQRLEKFLNSLGIPFITTLRDTQHYIRSNEEGKGMFDMPTSLMSKDLATWQPLLEWLQQCEARKTQKYATLTSSRIGK